MKKKKKKIRKRFTSFNSPFCTINAAGKNYFKKSFFFFSLICLAYLPEWKKEEEETQKIK